MFYARSYQKLLNYLDDLRSDKPLYQGFKLYLDRIIYNKDINSKNPYYNFYYGNYENLESEFLSLDDDFHNLYLGHLFKDEFDKAENYYKKADHLYQSKAYCALIYINKKDYQKAKYLLEATEDFILSPYYLGYLYANGLGVDKNIDNAIFYYTKSASLGFQDASYLLATTYKNNLDQKFGNGYSDKIILDLVNKLHPQAILNMLDATQGKKQLEILTKAINSPDGDLKYQIGLKYFYGNSLPCNKELSKYWLALAAQLNNRKAIKFLEENFD
ncbi:MAG TPA: sel1 repeat family protein [Acholeplasmataceae bacterium]|nr:sel1 repeat family protein [Acholeplasmataceae bacterium]